LPEGVSSLPRFGEQAIFFSNTASPASVALYRCIRLRGLSGMVNRDIPPQSMKQLLLVLID
jgi:hypothetical protein